MPEPTYRYDESIHAKHRSLYHKRIKVLAVVSFLAVVAVALLIISLLLLRGQTGKSKVGPAYQQAIAGPHLFKSTYFEFSDTSPWQFSAKESTANKFTYL